jgi:hypothetical protein
MPLHPAHEQLIADCQGAGEFLSDWEIGFIGDISVRIAEGKLDALSQKQLLCVVRAWNRIPKERKSQTTPA